MINEEAEVARIMAMSDDEIMREVTADDAAWARGFKLGQASGKSAALASAPAAWIVGNGDGTKWRTWGLYGSEWTDDRDKATRYARREDAEAVHAGDEDAWTVQPYAASAPARDGVEALHQSAAKYAAICDKLADQTPVAGEQDSLWWERQSALREAGVLLAALARPHSAVAPAGDGVVQFRNRVVRMLHDMFNECTHSDTEAFAYQRAEKEVRAMVLDNAALARPRAAVDRAQYWTDLLSDGLGADRAGCWRCGAISKALDAILTLEGYTTAIVQGSANGVPHVWVEADGVIYDATAGQFNAPIQYSANDSLRAAVGKSDDETCTGCDGSGFDPVREAVCHCQPEQQPRAAVGEREAERLRIAEQQFDAIRLILIDQMHEPLRGAFWKAVEARDAIRSFLALQSPPAKVEGDCPSSPDGRHQVDTSMESGSNNCFHCNASMKRAGDE